MGFLSPNYAEMVELVDTLGLEPSALRCAGSSPVLRNEAAKTAAFFYLR